MHVDGHLTIVGLGPGNPDMRTLGARGALDGAATIILRTRVHPGLDDLVSDARVVACDDLYESAAKFDDLYDAIADRVCTAAQGSGTGQVVYAVPGHPRFGEHSVRRVVERAATDGIEVQFIDTVSAVDSVATLLGIDPMADEVQLVDGASLAAVVNEEPYAGGRVVFTPLRPLLISQVYSRPIATGVKLALARLLPDDHPITIVRAAGIPTEEAATTCALYELDHGPVDHLTTVWVPALGALDAVRDPRTLQHVVARLRAPGGCPWDRKQTHTTLRDGIINEAYEVLDAIDAGDEENLAEELGDLFLLIAMHAQLAEENGTFSLEDVYEGITRKLIRRHPHVFGDRTAASADDVVKTWNEVKAEEKAGRTVPQREKALDGQPRAMPALVRARRVLDKHPYTCGIDPMTDASEALLAVVAGVIDTGHDPETALREALARHVERSQNKPAAVSTLTPNEEKERI